MFNTNLMPLNIANINTNIDGFHKRGGYETNLNISIVFDLCEFFIIIISLI